MSKKKKDFEFPFFGIYSGMNLSMKLHVMVLIKLLNYCLEERYCFDFAGLEEVCCSLDHAQYLDLCNIIFLNKQTNNLLINHMAFLVQVRIRLQTNQTAYE